MAISLAETCQRREYVSGDRKSAERAFFFRAQQQEALGREGDFAGHASLYGRVQAGLALIPDVQERRKGSLLSCPSWAVCVTCGHLFMLGVVSTQPH
jgi:hypothetical protein